MALSPITLRWTPGTAPQALREREWLTTNGLGGYASGSLLGVPTRHYHGMFVPNLTEPTGRFVCIARLDERVSTETLTADLSGAEFRDRHTTSDAANFLREFRLDAMTPVWLFELGDTLLEKSIVMPQGLNTSCVRYRVLGGPPVSLRVRLFGAARRLNAPVPRDESWPFALHMTGERIELRTVAGMTVRIAPSQGAAFHAERQIDYNVLFAVERDRGYDHFEHQHSPGYFDFELSVDREASLLFSTEPWETMSIQPSALFAAEQARLTQLVSLAGVGDDVFAQHLVMAADQFIVTPGSRRDESLLATAGGADVRSVMAGYHWFNDWGRDTMISFEGLTLCTRRLREARAILRTFAGYVKDGLLPNLFPEGERQARYHTADATLWFFHAIDRYLAYTRDMRLLSEVFPVLQSIIGHHLRGTHFGIGADPDDGLLRAAAEGYQLTWMDAKVGDEVVTPRRGKPVEIQALWYNALCCMAAWADRMGSDGSYYRGTAERVRDSFNKRFWNESAGCLLDVIDGPEGDESRVRPNQIFALSLPHSVLDAERWNAVFETVTRELLTPLGLRTLAPDDPDYRGHYEGTLHERDSAYHQGTVWPWLLGAYVDAWLIVRGDSAATRAEARHMLARMATHLGEAGIGSISEIFDADPPFTPRGTIAQAWSVAEVLRAWRRTMPDGAVEALKARASVMAAAGPLDGSEWTEPTGEEDTYAGLVNEPVAQTPSPTPIDEEAATGEEDPFAGIVDEPVAERP